jgi:hypothetical protein
VDKRKYFLHRHNDEPKKLGAILENKVIQEFEVSNQLGSFNNYVDIILSLFIFMIELTELFTSLRQNKQQLNATLLGKEDDAFMPFFN